MKKLIFTLMMMAGLALVAGTAMALNDTQVYAGGTYSYKLNNITVDTEGTATIVFEDAGTNTGNATVSVTSGFSGASSPYTAQAATDYSAEFNLTFNSGVAEGAGTLTVTVTDGGTNACSNFIDFTITVIPPPSYELVVVESESNLICQQRTGAGNNTADALGDGTESNSFTFTVTPSFSGMIENTEFSYAFSINIADNSDLLGFEVIGPDGSTEITYGGQTFTYSGITYTAGYTPTDHVFTVNFNTTTGVSAQEILATLSLTSGTDILTVVGGVEEDASVANAGDDTATLTVGAVPSIGTFGN